MISDDLGNEDVSNKLKEIEQSITGIDDSS